MATTNTLATVPVRGNAPAWLPNIPANYPLTPHPGKVQMLFTANTDYLYSKLSPYTNYQASNVFGGILSDKQPFVYTSIETGQSNVNGFNSLGGQILDIARINTGTVDDIKRVSKFLISSWGVTFLSAQLAIQRTAPFDETRIYNPAETLLATVQPLTLGIGQAPIRHVEPIGSGILGTLLGGLNSITSTVGINLQNGFSTPSSTVGDPALPPDNFGEGKGLIRGSDAARGLTSLQSKWITSNNQGGFSLGGALSNFAGSIASSFMSFFGGAPKAKGIFRSDEQAYMLMATKFGNIANIGSGNSPASNTAANVPIMIQSWFAPSANQVGKLGNNGMPLGTKGKSTFGIVQTTIANPSGYYKSKLISTPDGWDIVVTSDGLTDGFPINGRPTGYTSTTDKYGDSVGRVQGDDLTNSDMLVQYSYYVQEDNEYASKISNTNSDTVKAIQKNLQNVISNINKNGNGTYDAIGASMSYLLPDATDPLDIGFDALYQNTPTSKTDPLSSYGVINEYINGESSVPTIDALVKKGIGNNIRMASAFLSDGLNNLGVLGGDRLIDTTNSQLSKDYTGWSEWKPYEDDLIAFFFYDVVNDKYIPFRATVKGISEGATAFWDELRFIGRADQLYSYNGFSRALSFTFNVVINSVTELWPTWKKINYIVSAVKPSNYTTGQTYQQSYNRFIVPPMFMMTIGDLYKFQPVVFTSITVNIPDDAIWETLNQDNAIDGWEYLNGMITAPNIGKYYGQLPREAEIAITCNLLEKERAIVGGSQFGHEPRVDDWESQPDSSRFLVGNVPYLPTPTILHQGLVQWNKVGTSRVGVPTSTAPPVRTTPKINRGGQLYTGTTGIGA